VIGAGNEGQGHAFIISLLTPGLRRILFRDIVPEHAEAAVEEFKPVADYLHKERGTELIVAEVADPDDQRVELESDAIVTATMATEEVLSNPNFKEGIVIASVGADMIGKQELGSAIYDQAKFVADDLRQSLREGELQHAAKHLGIRKIQREGATYHGSLLEGRIIGITNLLENPQAFIDRPEPITVYDSTGFSGQDLAVGRLMMRCLDGLSWPKVQFHPPRTNMSFSELFHAGRKETQPQAD
jgi:ornithine cyclodeaminase/alanine dehydrogenase-like protein (mu-crystallin family)